MIIESIEIYRVNMPLVYPFRTAFGDTYAIESVLVKMTGGGRTGWGETSPWASPAYSPEWAAGVFSVMRDWLAPRLIGKDIASGAQLQSELALFKGNFFAKAGLDLAWWDLHAQLLGKPLWQIIGGKSDTIEVGADFGVMETFDLLLKEIDGAVRQGFKRVKLKFRPGWELDMVKTVRKHFPKAVFHVDCNSAYRLFDSAMLRQLDQYNLAMIEQPLAHDDLHEHAQLQKLVRTPVCLDESITSPVKAAQAIELGACRWINIKPGRVGGITNALAINQIAEAAGIPVWIGGMLESSVGGAHCQALATLANSKYPSDIFPTSRFYAQDLSEPPLDLSGPSVMKLAGGSGIGHQPHPDRLAKLSLESVVIVGTTTTATT
ncbi:MAG: o-succinylbenzoate synthase [Verrucomicrobiae bacterium]|nr:o-succinylbenzoate synthase [Verrucomicrobiae bacterium]